MPRRPAVTSDLGLGADPVRSLSDQPWMPMPSARVAPAVTGNAEALLRGLAQLNDGITRYADRKIAEERQREKAASLAAGKRAGFDPEFQKKVEAGEVRISDSAAFEMGRSEAAAEADGNVLNSKLGEALRPDMTDEEYEEAFNATYESVASGRDANDHLYHAQLGESASRIREQHAGWLAGQRRERAEDDAVLQIRRVAAQRTREWVESGSGDIEALKAELSAVDRHAAATGLSGSQRATLLSDTLADMIDVTGNPNLAAAADVELFGGGRLDDLVGAKVTARAVSIQRQQRADARAAATERRMALTEARAQFDSDLAAYVISNPNAPIPEELVARAQSIGEVDKLLAYGKRQKEARALYEAPPDQKAQWLVEAGNGVRSEADIIEGFAAGHYSATERNAQLNRAKGFKENGALSKRPEVGHGISRIRSLFADERKADGAEAKLALLKPAADKLETTTQELEEQAIVEYQNRLASFLAENPDAPPNALAIEASKVVNEVYQVGKLRREAEKAHLSLAPPTAQLGTPTSRDPGRDMLAVQALSGQGPLGMSVYRNLSVLPAVQSPQVAKAVKDAAALWKAQKQPHPALLKSYRDYQDAHGPTPYPTFLTALRVLTLNVSGGATAQESPTK